MDMGNKNRVKYGEAKAVDSIYASRIFGIGVFTPE